MFIIRRLLCRHFKKYIQRRVIPIFDDGLFIIFYTLRLLIDLVRFYLILHETLFISKHSRSRLSSKNLLDDLKQKKFVILHNQFEMGRGKAVHAR